MQTRRLGTSDIEVSVIGLGTVKFGRNQGVKYPEAFTLPSDQELKQLLMLARELGINLLDTAPAYGISEERLGKLLAGEREHWVITTKVGEEFIDGKSHFDFSSRALELSVNRSLKRLRTDYLDVVLVHSHGEDVALIEEENVFYMLEKIKLAGKIRAYGMSTKTVAGGLLTIEKADVAMVTYHPDHTSEKSVIDYAHQQNKGIFIKKALASGHFSRAENVNPIREALHFILAEPGVTSIIIGTINPTHLRSNVEEVLSAMRPPSEF